MSSPTCVHCGTVLRLPLTIPTVRCPRCGAVHHSDGEVISPRMLPGYHSIDSWHRGVELRIPALAVGRLSPWMDCKYRPVDNGHYDVRFRDGTECKLYWQGHRFVTYDGRHVSERTLQSWRGSWE